MLGGPGLVLALLGPGSLGISTQGARDRVAWARLAGGLADDTLHAGPEASWAVGGPISQRAPGLWLISSESWVADEDAL